jgi:hypothetical protein
VSCASKWRITIRDMEKEQKVRYISVSCIVDFLDHLDTPSICMFYLYIMPHSDYEFELRGSLICRKLFGQDLRTSWYNKYVACVQVLQD